MKRFANVTALLAAMVMALALAGCGDGNVYGNGNGNGNGNGGKGALATKWVATQTRKEGVLYPYTKTDTDIVGGPITLAFYDNGTYVWSGPSEVKHEGDYKGTYTGNTATPGDFIKLTGDIFVAGGSGTVSDDGNSLNLNYDLANANNFSFKYYYLFKKSE